MAVEHVVHMTSDGVGAPKDPRSAEAPAAAAPTLRDAKGRVLPPERLPAKPAIIVPAAAEEHPAAVAPMFTKRELASFAVKWQEGVVDAASAWYQARQTLDAHPSQENELAFARAMDALSTAVEGES